MKFLKGVSLGDIVELEFQKSFTIEVSKVVGYVTSIDKDRIELSTYDLEEPKPFKYDSLSYEAKYIRGCTVLKRKN